MSEAIVLGANHHNTYGIIRALHAVGVKPTVICPPPVKGCCYKNSRYVGELVEIPESEVLSWLLDYGRKAESKAVVFVSSDSFSSLIDENSDRLKPYFVIPCSDESGKLTRLMDKQRMSDLAVECGLSVPPNSRVVETADLAREEETLKFPCIVKPYKSIEGDKSDIFICRDASDYRELAEKIKCPAVQIQDFIDKRLEYQLIGLSLDEGRTVVSPGVTRLIWASSESSNTGIVEIDGFDKYDDIPLDRVRSFIRATGYSGSFSVEFLRDKEGRDYFMEINFRNDGNAIVATAANVNLPAMWWEHATGGSVRKPNGKRFRKAVAIPFWSMLTVARRQGRLAELVRYLLKGDVLMDVSLADMRPFLNSVKERICNRMKR